ncbi:MAG: alpha/beta hydrolase [bacterium]
MKTRNLLSLAAFIVLLLLTQITPGFADSFFARQGFEAQWVSQTGANTADEFFSVKPCDSVNFTATFKNTGTTTWSNSGADQIAFNIYKDPKVVSYPTSFSYIPGTNESYFKDNTWLSAFRVGSLVQSSVKPGETGTIQMKFKVPCDAPSGKFREDISMAAGKYWMKNTKNGDPQKVAHIWVGFNIQATSEVTISSATCPTELAKYLNKSNHNYSCSYITVPESHASPNGKTIKLAVIVIKGTWYAGTTPLVMEQGGPGGSTLEYFSYADGVGILDPFLRDRDIILVEQRGTHYSLPNLACSEVNDAITRTLDSSTDVKNAAYDQAVADCYSRLKKQGVNLDAFNSVENAADIPDVVKALGYTEYNFYGVSYGAMLGQHLMKNYPTNLKSVILDSTPPLQGSFVKDSGKNAVDQITHVFSSCEADAVCNQKYPQLATVFEGLYSILNANPIHLSITDSNGKTSSVQFTGSDMVQLVFSSLYSDEMLRYIPKMIYDLKDGKVDLIRGMLSVHIQAQSTISQGMYFSVLCAEDISCPYWSVNKLGSSANEMVNSNIPTLVLNGEFDPITPPNYSSQILPGLTRHFSYTFPGIGHGVISSGSCPVNMMSEFLFNPVHTPDSSCISTMASNWSRDNFAAENFLAAGGLLSSFQPFR